MTSVVRLSRPSVGVVRPGGATTRPWWKPVLFHGLGLLGTVVVGLVTYRQVIMLFSDTAVCGYGPPAVGNRADLITGVSGLGVMAAVLPGVLALVARRRHLTPWPWAALAGLVLAGTAVMVLVATPLQDCFV
jgi:hypothetical protein